MVGALLLLCAAFDNDSSFARSLFLNLFTQYLRDDKNNALNIFMLHSSIQFSLHFILTQIMSHPDSRSDPIGGFESSSGCEDIYWDSLPA